MALYHYIALNPEGRELSGMIDAADEAAGRAHLNALGFSIISIGLSQAEISGKNSYEFEATDKSGKKVVGTIAAEDPMKAYARLREEYQLQVSLLAPQKKNKALPKPLAEIQAEYEKSVQKNKEKELEEQATEKAAEKEKKELGEKVDETARRVTTFLSQFGGELKPGEREAIQGYLDQLARIKDSANLDHIRSTCEKMLEHIQKEELFRNEKTRLREAAALKVDTSRLLADFKATGLQQNIDLVKTAESWEKNRLLKPLADVVLKLFRANNPEVRKIRAEIKKTRAQMWSYINLLVLAPTPIHRAEAWEGIAMLRKEKRRLEQKLAAVRMQEKSLLKETPVLDEIGAALGWVLSFYLAVYIVSYPFTIKNFGFAALPKNFYFYGPRLTTAATLFLFLLYGALGLHKHWFPKRSVPYFLLPLSLLFFLLIGINLL